MTEKRDRYGRQIEEAFEAASKLAGSNLPPTEFYEQFLNRTLKAIDAPAGAVWLRTPQGFLQIACQRDLEKVGLESRRGGRQCHNEVLRQVFQAAPPRPVMLEPNGRLAANQQNAAEGGGVPAANLTDYFALFAPIVTPDKQPFGVLEVFQEASHDPRLYPTFLNYAFQMAGYASQYHQFSNSRASAGMERTFSQVEQFARLIHGSLNPTEVAYLVANEGRKLIECDRLCVGVRHARRKVTVEAVSGADVVEKASTHVRRLRKLMEAVLRWGEALTFRGTKEEGLPPDVSYALDEYLNESQPKLLIVQPIRDEREAKYPNTPARSVLVLESFNPPEQIEPMVQRMEVVAKHAAPALFNAAQMKRVPLKFLWWPIAKVQEGVGGKARFFMITGGILLAVIIGLLAAPPNYPPVYGYPLRMEAKGQLLPVEIAKVYAPTDGTVKDLRTKPGAQHDPGYPAVELYSPELEKQYTTLTNELREARATEDVARRGVDNPGVGDLDKMQTQLKLNIAQDTIRSRTAMLQTLDAKYHTIPNQPGYFQAIVPKFDPKLARPVGVSKWTVLNDDRRETLNGRTVRPNEELLRVGNLEGDWQVELKIPQRNVGQVMRAFADPKMHKVEPNGRQYLDVDVLLSSMADTRYLGRLYKDDISAEAVPNKNEHDENEPVVTAYVKLNLKAADFPEEKWVPRGQFVTGLEVRTRIRCGSHSVGYAMFHGVWEWFYEKVIFWF